MVLLRIKAFLIDYVVISMYLILLLGINLLLNPTIFDGGVQRTQLQTQWISFVASVLPITLLFSFLETRYGITLGKHLLKIKVFYPDYTFLRSLLRNGLKFLPWQLGHMSTIYALYVGTDIVFYAITLVNLLLVTYYIVSLVQHKTYLPDRVSQVTFLTNKN